MKTSLPLIILAIAFNLIAKQTHSSYQGSSATAMTPDTWMFRTGRSPAPLLRKVTSRSGIPLQGNGFPQLNLQWI
jgi:hypothetical protein